MKKRYTFRQKTKKQRRPIKQRGGSVDTIALCIPMDASDISMLPFCLKSIKEQTKAPDSIYMSISAVTPESEAAIKKIITDSMIPNINVNFRPDKILAGGNRNLAATAASSTGKATILSFMDSDDAMHPRRIERLFDIFKNPSITGVVHSYIDGKKANASTDVILPWKPISGQVLTDGITVNAGGPYRTIMPKHDMTPIANGHVSVRADFFKDHPYSETLAMGEDQEFNASILSNGKILALTPDTLSVYYR